MSSAVAIGAAYYGRVRRGAGLRVKAGSARSYYIGMRSEHGIKAVCVLPAGTNEGTTLSLLDREFSVLTNRPVSFHLYSSTIRHDAHGGIADLDPEEVHRHAPLVTLLRYGKKLQQMELAVRLSVSFTEVGTLELWCESVSSPHRWRLQFELRREASATDQSGYTSQPASTANRHDSSNISEQAQESAVRLIQRGVHRIRSGRGRSSGSCFTGGRIGVSHGPEKRIMADRDGAGLLRCASGGGRRAKAESATRGSLAKPVWLLPAAGVWRSAGQRSNDPGAPDLSGGIGVSARASVARSIGLCCGEGSRAASVLPINRSSGITSETSVSAVRSLARV